MGRRKTIDISTEEKKKDVFDAFNSLTSKNQAHKYFGISDNKDGSKYLNEIATLVGFDLTSYKVNRNKKRFCKQCGNEITSKWAKLFCSSSCAAKYNNEHRGKSIYEKVSFALRKTSKENCQIKQRKNFNIICKNCGKVFVAKNKNAKFCSNKCASENRHKECYADFLENGMKYCRGNYTPKHFKQDILNEQQNTCLICGCKPIHNGKPLIFVLDHIDGDASNNNRSNLRMICPNCDSQLETFKSKNKHSTRRNYWKNNILKQKENA